MTTSEIMIKIANSFKNEISDFNGLYLYGSRAKQMNSILSDYDVIFLSKRKLLSDEKSAIYKIVGKIEFEMDIFIDIQILTMEELLKNRFFYEEVTKYGQFYAAWKEAFENRQGADYSIFVSFSKEEVVKNYNNAKLFIEEVEIYILKKLEKSSN